ncbi:MAG: Ethanolamine utilization EutQ family protein [Myxococcaceae bacterium]|nr:Ethanolamine utilization EutQ family protein [Myxococcaceae bacterium]
MKRLITAEIVTREFASGRLRIAAPRGQAIITPAAWSKASELGVSFDQTPGAVAEPAPADGGSCERQVDPSGVVVVRGQSVRLGRFAGAGPDKQVGLTDVVTGKDRSPMTAGFMSWSKADSFPWTLDYDELDYVLEGVLQIGIAGRVVEGRPGDVLYLPRGSKVVFGTPSRTKIFYVTYPADWAGAPKAK